MITKLNHIGVAVESIDKTVAFFESAFGAREITREALPEAGQTSCLIAIGCDNFELMEPLGEGGVVRKFLDNKGEGFHHISLVSDDLDADCKRLEENGVKIVGKSQSGNLRVAFTHPKSTGGIVYEISQTIE
ncbi:MAG: VOC family protein [Clostridia bacterium]|nr:VOC family protein [Clostridia bacterium]